MMVGFLERDVSQLCAAICCSFWIKPADKTSEAESLLPIRGGNLLVACGHVGAIQAPRYCEET
jgi:hypothetical protein